MESAFEAVFVVFVAAARCVGVLARTDAGGFMRIAAGALVVDVTVAATGADDTWMRLRLGLKMGLAVSVLAEEGRVTTN